MEINFIETAKAVQTEGRAGLRRVLEKVIIIMILTMFVWGSISGGYNNDDNDSSSDKIVTLSKTIKILQFDRLEYTLNSVI